MTQKRQSTKKAPVSKKSSAKKGSAAKKAPALTWKFYAVTIGIFVVATLSVLVIALFTASFVATRTNQARLNQINDIYTSLNLDYTYGVESKNVFGDKRPFESDKTHSYPSEIQYVHADTVSNTFADLDGKIKAAGFAFVSEPYPDGKQAVYRYKSNDGEHLQLGLISKPYWDAIRNDAIMGRDVKNTDTMDTNQGPTRVVIKVNLDDSEE
jgi:hypothetical protein